MAARNFWQSFLIACAIYLPLILLSRLIFAPIEFEPALKFSLRLAQITFESEPQTPQIAQVAPAAPAIASAEPQGGELKQTLNAAQTPIKPKETNETLSVAELNSIFAPAPLPAKPETSAKNPAKPAILPTISAAELGDLYGLTLHELTPEEREFLEQNLNPIQTITQRYLNLRGYPNIAAQKGMQGDVILGFTLMPNGDITPIEVTRPSGWSILDDHAIDTIRVAYKDYPRPHESVRVRMRVRYEIR
ncbi:MAG: TonB family protein [Helicobacteraceae bacterium]|nr:TonB family protein [Helicobacteraceae bacterium]